MKKTFALVIPLLLFVCFNALAQSNKGTEFYTAFMSHSSGVTGSRGASMVLYITSDVSTKGKVEIAGTNFLQEFDVSANSVTFVDIPASAYIENQGISNNGIHITSESPITVYAHIYAFSVSGATLLLPVSTMGKEYMSLNYTQKSNATVAYSMFAVIATENNTKVSITPTGDLVDGKKAGVPFEITLNEGQVYQGLSLIDLTGTKIKSLANAATGTACQKIAVFSGSSKMGIGCYRAAPSSDNLLQQVYPTATWGKRYVAVPLASRPYDVYRIVLSDPNTVVTLNGTVVKNFTKNLYYEFNSKTTNVISADKPIQVIQYSASQEEGIDCKSAGSADTGDPEMIYLTPIEQGLNNITLYSTARYAIVSSFINVILPKSAVSTFTLDGKPYSNFKSVPGADTYAYAQIPVPAGSHTISAGATFNAIAYGFGRTESYGYAAGTNLIDFNTNVGFENKADLNKPLSTGCNENDYKLQVTIPYATTNIKWIIDGKQTDNVTNPKPVRPPFLKDGKMIYVYEYKNAQLRLPIGSHAVTASVFNPTSDECGSYQNVDNVITITQSPDKDFAVAATTCLGDETAFKYNASATGSPIKSWLWDFGDGAISAEQAPTHKYAALGNYNTRVTVVDLNGCSSTSDIKVIRITAKPIADFVASLPDCVSRLVTFSDKSLSGEPDAVITKWLWTFGDSSTSTERNPTHKFITAKTYDVKLEITTVFGCTSEKLVPVTIHPLPVADFTFPDACVNDRNIQFVSTSTIADATEAEFTYDWDFGDKSSTAIVSRLTSKIATHAYTAAGEYIVKLKVTSKYGCDSTITKKFIVNGANPVAAFQLLKDNTFCSNDSVAFLDQSTVDFGKITRLEWYFDYDNPNAKPVIIDKDHMRTDRIYRFFYGVNNTTVAKRYRVALYAYSGQTCFGIEQPREIVINPNPVVKLKLKASGLELTSPITVCMSELPFDIEAQSNIAGTAKFTGPGISKSGTFDPQSAGAGTHAYTMIFTASGSACIYATNFTIVVSPSPVISLAATHSLLEGEQLSLMPAVSIQGGGNLTYSWTPAAGLSQTNILNPVVKVNDDMTYTLSVTSAATGCVTTAKTTIKVLKIPVIPNAFTPNGDGINDTWEIKYISEYPNTTIEILNRAGNRVFYTNTYKPWDGRFNGADLPLGTYYYIIRPTGRKPISGYLNIIR